tara:strand:+ start:8936 stop:9118 length:183 start_codon:yes stop_codon:yes gene_type:complete
MKIGDLVIALDADRGIGIIRGVAYDHKGMRLWVVFVADKDCDHGYSRVYRPINLQIVEAK